MHRRLLYLLLIMTAIICVGSYQNRAEAADEYIGTNSYGNEVYLVTESIRETMLSHRGYFDGYQYDCRVKCVYPDTREYYTDDYSFICNLGILVLCQDLKQIKMRTFQRQTNICFLSNVCAVA